MICRKLNDILLFTSIRHWWLTLRQRSPAANCAIFTRLRPNKPSTCDTTQFRHLLIEIGTFAMWTEHLDDSTGNSNSLDKKLMKTCGKLKYTHWHISCSNLTAFSPPSLVSSAANFVRLTVIDDICCFRCLAFLKHCVCV